MPASPTGKWISSLPTVKQQHLGLSQLVVMVAFRYSTSSEVFVPWLDPPSLTGHVSRFAVSTPGMRRHCQIRSRRKDAPGQARPQITRNWLVDLRRCESAPLRSGGPLINGFRDAPWNASRPISWITAARVAS